MGDKFVGDDGRGNRDRGKNAKLEDWGKEGSITQMKPSGFGFIRPTAGQVDGSDLYFHAKECNEDTPFDSMAANDEVTFEVQKDDRSGKFMATNVTAKNGGGGSKRGRKDSRSRGRSDSRSRGRR